MRAAKCQEFLSKITLETARNEDKIGQLKH